MNKKRWGIGAIALLIALAGGGFLYFKTLNQSVPAAEYTISRLIRYGCAVENTTNRLAQNVRLSLRAPVKQTATQRCDALDANLPFERTVDDLGNQVLVFTIDRLPPYATRLVTVSARLMMAAQPGAIGVSPGPDTRQPAPFIESDNTELTAISRKLVAGSISATARKASDWVSGNLKPAGYTKNARGAIFALKAGTGDCTEYMYLFTALCRGAGIPARGVAGYVSDRDAVIGPERYHNWALFFDGTLWQIADPFNRVFTADQSNYIAMRLFGPEPAPFERFHIEGPEGVIARMAAL
ncbi:MAG: transglutaminase-like domain-containing protein [Pseudomonadota bacterium]